jgi:REP element-mobilizing transposase RayT
MPLQYRKHVRLSSHDYLQGAYFVTVCTYWRKQVFGGIVGQGVDARINLTDAGRIVDECWRAIPDHFQYAELHEMQIMPDHLHAIIVLNGAHDNGIAAATQ